AQWLIPGGEAYNTLIHRLLGDGSALKTYFRPEIMKILLENAATPTLWLLLFLEEWLRQHQVLSLPSKVHPAEISTPSARGGLMADNPGELARQAVEHARQGDRLEARKGMRQLVASWPGSPEGIDASTWLAKNPLDTSVYRPRILLIPDVPNWIFDRHAHTLKAKLAGEFDIEIAYGIDILQHGQPLDETRYDLIHPLEWHMVRPEMVHTPAKWVAGIRSHTSWESLDVSKLGSHLAQLFQGGVYVVSKRLEGIFKPSIPGVVHLPHGVDTSFFTSTRPPGGTAGKLRVGWAGNRASAVKGFEEFIAPLGQIAGVELVFCGYGDRLLNLEEMQGFYEDIDVYVCTSASEGHNNSLMEAASMARAIVTTDVGTVPEFLEDGVSALIVPREADAIAQAILRLRDDPELRKRLGTQARISVMKHFDWSARLEDYRLFFRKALSATNPGHLRGLRPTQDSLDIVPEAFLFEPRWNSFDWVKILGGYLDAFTQKDPVALVFLMDPARGGQISMTEAEQSVLEV
ncbi:glycosyltransferase family 4 protein, partial [bacterium]|nr:glycosyltransferase family 4 protein [bacterium]